MPETTETTTPAPEPAQPTIATTSSLRTAKTVLEAAWGIYVQEFWVLLGVILLPVLVAMVIVIVAVIVIALLGVSSLATLMAGGSAGVAGGLLGLGVGLIALMVLIVILAALGYFWAQLATLYVIKDRQEHISVLEAYRRARHNLFAYAWVWALTVLSVVCGLILVIIPGIIVGVWFSFAGYVLVAEDVHGTAALKKSKEYVRGIWGAVFSKYAFIVVLWMIVSIVLNLISKNLANLVTGLVLSPLATIYGFELYQDVKKFRLNG
jgi:hypothetical protein